MYCPKCKKEVNTGKQFCDDCGSRLLADEKVESNIIIEASSNSKVIDNISMVEAFVGGSYQKIRSIGFSIGFFFFGPYYALYRKMYLFGIIYLAISIAILLFIPKLYIMVSIVNIVLSLRFNNLYLSWVSKKVDKLRVLADSDNRSDVLKLCSERGGCNIAAAFIGLMIFGYFSYNIFYKKGVDILSQYGLVSSTVKSATDYKKLEFVNPSDMKSENNTSGEALYNYESKSSSCSYTVILTDTNYTAHNYLNKKSDYTAKDSKEKVQQIDINGNKWDLLKVNTNSATVYDYAILYDHVLYNVTYKVYKDNNGKCELMRQELEKSLKFKK